MLKYKEPKYRIVKVVTGDVVRYKGAVAFRRTFLFLPRWRWILYDGEETYLSYSELLADEYADIYKLKVDLGVASVKIQRKTQKQVESVYEGGLLKDMFKGEGSFYEETA